MKEALGHWFKANSVMLTNAGSLVGATVVTSGLGFVFWWVAARRFPLESVGIASASISMMMLLGTLCMLGLGTLLITELPRQPGRAGSLISTALIVVGGTGGCIGVLFAILAPYASAEFLPFRASIADILIFGIGVSLTSITLVLDQALVGLLNGGLQLWRNTFFSIAKLAVLFVVSLWLSQAAGITIYATWALGNAFSLAALAGVALRKGKWSGKIHLPQWGLLRKLGATALQHHLLNLTLQAPSLLIPLLVTVLLSAKDNAWFYVSSMIASFVTMIPVALTVVLHAMNSAQQSTLGHKARVTIGLALVTSVLANCLLQFDTKQVLGLFGSSYAEQATWSLRILGLQAFPLIVKTHYISICRIQDRITSAMMGMLPGGLLELVLAALGAHYGGLSGLCLGQTVAIYIESIFMFRTVYGTIRSANTSSQAPPSQQVYGEGRPLWLIDTSILMSIRPSYKIKAVRPADINGHAGTSTKSRSPETKVEVGKSCERETDAFSSSERLRLRPVRLLRYAPNHDGTNITVTSSGEPDLWQ